jgi:Na+-driven multidrug efflux pump
MLTAVANLFAVGGGAVLSRSLGAQDRERAGNAAATAFWGGLLAAVLFCAVFGFFSAPLLRLCGATDAVLSAALIYARWAVAAGGVGTVLSVLLSHLIRAEGAAAAAALGVSFGAVLNIALDPLFILPRFLGLGAAGAGLATALSNIASAGFFFGCLCARRRSTVVSLSPRRAHDAALAGEIVRIGLPSAVQYALTVVAVAAQARFVSAYATEAVAALGIIKKLDQLPLYFSIGVANGLLPLLAYTHAAGLEERRRAAFRFGCAVSCGFALLCFAVYECAAPALVGLFLRDAATIRYGARFLRIMVVAMPLMSLCYPMIVQFQAMGSARESLVCSVLRKGVLDLPLLVLFDRLLPLYGCMAVQPVVDGVSLAAALWFLRRQKKT